MRKISLASAPAKLAVVLALGLLLTVLGCGRRQVANPPAENPPPRPQETSQVDEAAAKQVVTDYLRALYKKNYDLAYGLLAEASRQSHSREAFEKSAQEAQVVYDLARIWAEKTEADRAEVIAPFPEEEEPGGKAFSLVKEKGNWKIIYNVGTPFSPYEK